MIGHTNKQTNRDYKFIYMCRCLVRGKFYNSSSIKKNHRAIILNYMYLYSFAKKVDFPPKK